jgi:hypothetical protein
MQPVVLDELLDKSKYQELLRNLPSIDSGMIDSGRSRHMADNDFIKRMGISLEAVAKKVFGSDSLQSSYSLYCRYYGDASMEMHKDDNACTYTIDLCVRQTEPWPIYVEGNQYLLKENQALCYLGNDQLHGRQPKNLGPNGSVEMVFFHFVEPDHWFFAGR